VFILQSGEFSRSTACGGRSFPDFLVGEINMIEQLAGHEYLSRTRKFSRLSRGTECASASRVWLVWIANISDPQPNLIDPPPLMTKLKPLFAFLGLLAICPAFIPTNGQCTAADKPLKLAILANSASDFWTYVKAGAEKATQEVPNVSVEVRLVPDGTPAEQTRIFDDLLVKGTDGIAISPLDSANQAAMIDRGTEKAMISTTDSDAATSKRAFYVGTSNVDAGRQAGGLIKKAIPDGGKIMIFVGKRDAQNAKERIQGLEEVLKGSNVSVIDVRTDDTDRVRARQNVADTLVKYPDIACLVGIWSYNGPAIVNSVKSAGKVGKVKVVTFDEEDDTLQGIKDGIVDSTVVQNPYEFGHQSTLLLAKKLRGEEVQIPENKQVIVPTRAIDKSNVDDFWTTLKKLRGH
jgi:ribose transport system substrate-binding protein